MVVLNTHLISCKDELLLPTLALITEGIRSDYPEDRSNVLIYSTGLQAPNASFRVLGTGSIGYIGYTSVILKQYSRTSI